MKYILSLLSVVFISLFSGNECFGQVDLHSDSDPGTTLNGTVVNLNIDQFGYTVYMQCVNTSGVAANYKFRRLILSQSTTFTDQFCDNNLCYPCSGTDYITPNPVSVPSNDSSLFKPIFNFSNGGTALIRYYVLDADNNDAAIDSVDFNINSTVGLEEEEISLSTYPNPVSDVLFVELNSSENGFHVITVNDLLGNMVLQSTISEGLNEFQLSSLQNGIYICTISTENKILKTEKFILNR